MKVVSRVASAIEATKYWEKWKQMWSKYILISPVMNISKKNKKTFYVTFSRSIETS